MTETRYCFCALALGERYARLAAQLANDLATFAPGAPFVVLSDRAGDFANLSNVVAIPHRQRSLSGYHDKLCVVNRALQLYDACILLDADGRIFEMVRIAPEALASGLSAARIRSWEYCKAEASNAPSSVQFNKAVSMMANLRKDFGIDLPDKDVPFVCEYLFSVSRSGSEDFLRRWSELSDYSQKSGLHCWEGYSIGLAAILSGFPLREHWFVELNYFEPMFPLSDYRERGVLLTRERYDSLAASVNAIKHGDLARPLGVAARARRRMLHTSRLIRWKVAGMNLLD